MPNTTQRVSLDQIAINKKLESIFLPHIHVRREWKRAADNPDVPISADNRAKFVHYTSADAGLKIVESKRLWMRSTTCMADYREVSHGYDLLLKYFRTEDKHSAFLAAMDDIRPGSAEAAIGMFDKWWTNIQVNTYITSVSEHVAATEDFFGRLSMWRAFGAGQPRVALVFSVPWESQATAALGIMFGPVAYLSEASVLAALDNCLTDARRERDWLKTLPQEQFQGAIFQMLASSVCCLKHEGFWEEREWRGVYLHGFGQKTLLERATEVIGGVPQPIFKVPFDATASPELADLDLARILDRVIIGRTSYGWVMYEAFVEALAAAGAPDPAAKVKISNLPIREN
jgi:hypothetical protein